MKGAADGQLETIVDPENHLPRNRFNDGKVDPRGRFVAGTMSTIGEKQRGSLYLLDEGLRVQKIYDHLAVSNGLDWSPDGKRFYLIDSGVIYLLTAVFNSIDRTPDRL